MRTCTVMTYTDGKECLFAVMRGPYNERLAEFMAHGATTLAVYRVKSAEIIRDYASWDAMYRQLTARHATPAAPAVLWQALI